MSEPKVDWTAHNGWTNSSPRFLEMVAEVKRILASEAGPQVVGGHEVIARLIVAQLAHKCNMSPEGEPISCAPYEVWGADGVTCLGSFWAFESAKSAFDMLREHGCDVILTGIVPQRRVRIAVSGATLGSE